MTSQDHTNTKHYEDNIFMTQHFSKYLLIKMAFLRVQIKNFCQKLRFSNWVYVAKKFMIQFHQSSIKYEYESAPNLNFGNKLQLFFVRFLPKKLNDFFFTYIDTKTYILCIKRLD